MGLDMYLTATTDGQEAEAGCWRKANAIHGWFVEKVQGGTDNCEEHSVTIDELLELQALCQQVIDTAVLAPGKVCNGQRSTATGWEDIMEDGIVVTNADEVREILPPTQGFFFGSSHVDGYFIEDMERTVQMIDRCKDLADSDPAATFGYRSCW